MRLANTSSRVRSSGASRSISASNVRLASSIIAHSSPRTARPSADSRSGAIRTGSFPSVSRPSELASRRAGSIVTTATRRPRSASPRATAAAVVVLPTPPEPAQITIRRPASIGSTEVSMRTRGRETPWSRCLPAVPASDQAFAYGEGHRLRTAARVELGHDVVQDVLDRALGVAELLGDLAGRMTGGDQREHLLLAVRERGLVGAPVVAVVPVGGRADEPAEQLRRHHAGAAGGGLHRRREPVHRQRVL